MQNAAGENGAYLVSPTPGAKNQSRVFKQFKDYPGGVRFFAFVCRVRTSSFAIAFSAKNPTACAQAQAAQASGDEAKRAIHGAISCRAFGTC